LLAWIRPNWRREKLEALPLKTLSCCRSCAYVFPLEAFLPKSLRTLELGRGFACEAAEPKCMVSALQYAVELATLCLRGES
jgi:hypothetical protein